MKKNFLLLLIAVATICTFGCASIYTVGGFVNQADCNDCTYIPRVYSGLFFSVCNVITPNNVGMFLIPDVPLSLVADTLVLPYTIYRQQELGSICHESSDKDKI